ncbi:helix-turn-helix domain-containing protein [Paraburkholderia phenazinium]|uniref:helix-turn-helix domain-containing protein n=1 Tax=Paraburkholderia phenazinium TaxID=60549 RepID=UPI00158B3798|nr:helix-turn-helix transcriptional regulator [Paraburkholderia phenazinium]
MNENLTPEQAALRFRLSKNLKKLRAAQKISQEALADRAGLHRTYVSQVERMVTNASLDNICLLAVALESDPATLFAATVEQSERQEEAEHPSNKKARRATTKI